MLLPSPRRSPYWVGEDLVSFGGLDRVHVWPSRLASEVRAQQLGQPLSSPTLAPLIEEMLAPAQAGEEVFPLRQIGSGWTNSLRGQRWLELLEGPWTVVDALSLEDIGLLPSAGGGFLYLGDAEGGFHVRQAPGRDGSVPCARCLLLRYLAGRRASSWIFRALQQGQRVALPWRGDGSPDPTELETFLAEVEDTVLPLPDCRDCLTNAPGRPLAPGLFSPIRKVISLGDNHGAHLPEMLWLSGQETVGAGGCYDPDSERGVAKAINEALERYAAHFAPPSTSAEGVPFCSDAGERLFSRQRALLTEPGSVSTGLACHHSLAEALEHGLAEICERDALARFWLALDRGEGGVARLDSWHGEGLTGGLYQVDSYHAPTVLCLARTADGNVATGSAAGPVPQACEKAAAECRQNAAYLRTYAAPAPQDPPESFTDHARLYWGKQRTFPDLERCLLDQVQVRDLPAPVYCCELTTPDLALVGRHVVRVQVPGLLYLPMSHHDWPQLLRETGWPSTSPPRAPHPFS